MQRAFLFVATAILLLSESATAAIPTFSLRTSLSASGKSLTMHLVPSGSATGCEYSVYASSSRGSLSRPESRGVLVATVKGGAGTKSIRARNIGTLKRGSDGASRESVYFRGVLVCGVSSRKSEIREVSVKTLSSGSLARSSWIKRLRNRVLVGTLRVRDAFPNLEAFSQPVDIQNAGDGSGRLFVAEQGGKVYLFNNSRDASTRKLFLDIGSLIASDGERGLLGLAFHPSYESNGFFYVHYSKAGSGDTVIARFRVSSGDTDLADSASETILLEQVQPYANHNGGSILFGPDGYLYIALGDGGSGGDPEEHGQNRASLLGKILRIDVDTASGGRNYSIPPSNPFAGNVSGFREEIFAYGLRNPYRVSFDSSTGVLWCGDVGQDKREEVNIIESGGNYGWNTMEGTLCYDPSSGCDKTGLTLPIYDYPHNNESKSITGGVVYRGVTLPLFDGVYLFADFISGQIWGLDRIGSRAQVTELFDTDHLIAAFGTDEQGEVFFAGYGDGRIYSFR